MTTVLCILIVFRVGEVIFMESWNVPLQWRTISGILLGTKDVRSKIAPVDFSWCLCGCEGGINVLIPFFYFGGPSI